ncbi:lysine histidine transporter-like 8 protein [Tanacetum coccineum]
MHGCLLLNPEMEMLIMQLFIRFALGLEFKHLFFLLLSQFLAALFKARAWGVIALTLAFIWQLYTLYLLVNLHESPETGIRYSRYMQLANATFGYARAHPCYELGPPLSAGTCVALIIIGGSTSKIFFQVVCAANECKAETLMTVEWYLVFTCGAGLLSQLPNLNSIAGISLVGGNHGPWILYNDMGDVSVRR